MSRVRTQRNRCDENDDDNDNTVIDDNDDNDENCVCNEQIVYCTENENSYLATGSR